MHADAPGSTSRSRGRAKSWVYRFMLAGKARTMGLGSFAALSLAEAREKAAECRRLKGEGIDPIEARNAARTEGRVAAAKAVPSRERPGNSSLPIKAGWRNEKHVAQWTNTLATYAARLPASEHGWFELTPHSRPARFRIIE